MVDKNFLSLDLESNQPSGTIIQVGACVGNLKSGEILEEYSAFIHTDEILSDFIIKLTSIKQKDVNNGISLVKAYECLISMFEKWNCQNRGCVLTWGGSDTQDLKNQLGLKDYNKKPEPNTWYFGRRWIDVKTIFVAYQCANDKKHQAGLSKALTKVGLQFKGRKHNAKFDAINTFRIFRELMKRMNNE
jgi:inhibitor of KinA sporulation pathway (predicted exonuclease)